MKKTTLQIALIISSLCSVILIYFKFNKISIISITLTLILLLAYIFKLRKEKVTPEISYNLELKNLIKTYETVLVDTDKIPELNEKNIVITSSFEKLVDVQYVIKKPILYKRSYKSCSFILIDSEMAYIYILRETEDSFSPLDRIVSKIEMDNKKRSKEKKLLDDIDKTTIIKLDNEKEYKVSPVRKKTFNNIGEIIREETKDININLQMNKTEILEEQEVI